MSSMTKEELITLLKEIAVDLVKAPPKALSESDRLFREANKKQRKAMQEAIKEGQDACPHIAGCNPLSEFPDKYNRTCIVWHRIFSDSAPVGICTNCQRIFRPEDPDYLVWNSKESINKLSIGRTPCPPSLTLEEESCITGLNLWGVQKIDDSSSDPNLWSDEKIDLYLKVEKDLYRMNKRRA